MVTEEVKKSFQGIRSIGILRNMLKSDDEPTREAAEAALQEVAKSPRAAAARRAAEALKPAEEALTHAARFVPGVPGAAIQIAVGRPRRVNVRMANGVKTVSPPYIVMNNPP